MIFQIRISKSVIILKAFVFGSIRVSYTSDFVCDDTVFYLNTYLESLIKK